MVSQPSTGYGKAIFFKFFLELAGQMPVGSGAQIQRPEGAIRPGLIEINPKVIVPIAFYFISLFGSISWFLHFVALLLLTISWWDLTLAEVLAVG